MGFWYLASPYSKYPRGIERAFEDVCYEAARLIKAGVPVYSPIAHTHQVAKHGLLDPYDHDLWMPFDKCMIRAAKGLIVLKLEGWSRSYGISEEIKEFAALNKPICYIWPGDMPEHEQS